MWVLIILLVLLIVGYALWTSSHHSSSSSSSSAPVRIPVDLEALNRQHLVLGTGIRGAKKHDDDQPYVYHGSFVIDGEKVDGTLLGYKAVASDYGHLVTNRGRTIYRYESLSPTVVSPDQRVIHARLTCGQRTLVHRLVLTREQTVQHLARV